MHGKGGSSWARKLAICDDPHSLDILDGLLRHLVGRGNRETPLWSSNQRFRIDAPGHCEHPLCCFCEEH